MGGAKLSNTRDGQSLPSGVVLLVTDIDAPSGGIQTNSRLLLKELQKRGVSTYACVRNYHCLPAAETVEGTRIRRWPVVGRGLAITGAIYFFSTLLWLIRNRGKYDLVHCQQMFGPTMAAAVASFFTGKPILTRVTTVGELGEGKQIREMPLAGIRLALIKKVTRWAALTAEMKRELVDLGVPPDRVRIIHNATNIPPGRAFEHTTKARLRRKLGLGPEKIGTYVGRLSEEKNLETLLTAWVEVRAQYPQAQLLLLGAGGGERNVELELRALAADLGLQDCVHFLGHMNCATDYVTASDVFILPSRTEGMSNALVEALACGAAVVATDIPGNAEICTHKENALLVPVGDPAALSVAVTAIFGSPEVAAQLGASARRRAEHDLSVDHMIGAYLQTYGAMLSTGG